MHPLATSPRTDPTALYRVRDGLYAADMLIAAIAGLDFFTWFGKGERSNDEICRHFGFQDRPVDAMTTLFVAMQLLRRTSGGLELTELAREHLVGGSQWGLGPYFPKVSDRPIAKDFLEILKSGAPANFASRKADPDWHRAMETEKFATEFIAAMDCRGVLLAGALAQNLALGNRRKLLDIAGGSGIYACSICSRFPGLQATVLEKSPVDRIARRAIADRQMSERVDVLASDMLLEPIPRGFDVHLFSNVLHDWDIPVVQQLLRVSCASIEPGGTVIIHDAFLNEDKTGPLHIAEYSVLLVHVTQGRCYSIREIGDWLREAGFEQIEHVGGAAGRSALVATKA